MGAEEELFLLGKSGELAPGGSASLVNEVHRAISCEPGAVTSELFAAQIEFATGVCNDAGEIVPQLAAFRAALLAAGGRPLGAGLHPTAPFGEATLNPAPRYQLIGQAFAGLLRTPTAAFQVHVGLPDDKAALLAYRGIRNRLAVLQALTSNSPFWHGRDSGLASARWAVISSYPRGGVPPLVRTWDEYCAVLDTTTAASQAPDYTHVWWDARLQPELGTIEVRVMDAQSSMCTAAGVAALVQGLVRHAVENPAGVDLPDAVLAENSFRVARHGLETTVVGPDGIHRPVRELAFEALRDARSVLAGDGLERPLVEIEKILAEPPEYERQRRLQARSGVEGVLADLAARTQEGVADLGGFVSRVP